jgi:hypothetical protein
MLTWACAWMHVRLKSKDYNMLMFIMIALFDMCIMYDLGQLIIHLAK